MSNRQTLAAHIEDALAALVNAQLDLFAADHPGDEPRQAAHRALLVEWADHAPVRPGSFGIRRKPRVDVRSASLTLEVELPTGRWVPLCRVRVDQICREDGQPIADRADVRALLVGLGWLVPAGLEDLGSDLSDLVPDDVSTITEPPAGPTTL